MRRASSVLLTCLICLGCASRPEAYWYHPDKTLEEARADCKACTRQAQAHVQEEHIRRYQESVEHDRPWQMDEAIEETNRELDERNSFHSCMTAKGYRQQREFPLGAEIRRGECFGGDAIQHVAGR